ncbi:dephospho-CoA kinase [Marinobacter nanhaiticus D15-8W]|uniref:Dephospho-CoA kinase n=1 Tax=Marinobacter nanhaiticus D15-8W TaxID=626887 RepID=N6VTA9_9GAMM|nr:dephospho-CoA kinase [Marinobacter nanhaiticus]ENO13400.1 dephospho-CoA kinase [Marinobacter nanhaiticus D15-8W]BES70767.1 dephospho-CoA kinase [Marinobacter nanhaiticus D15-8W]
MRVIGLTGGIGSGKSTVARLFEQEGVHAVDADTVAREVVEPGTSALAKIADHFGPAILTAQGALDRAALRRIVFEAPAERDWLEKLLHPIIRDELMRQLWLTPDAHVPQEYKAGYVLLVSPLLLETDQHQLVEQVIVVDVPVETQIERTMARDDNDRAQVERIVAAQMNRKKRLESADIVVDNTRPVEEVADQVRSIHHKLSDEG